LGLGLLMVGLLAGMLYLASQASGRQTIVFPDGTRLTVVGITRGGEFFTEKGWQKVARKVLPQRWQGWLPKSLAGWTLGNTNNPTVWFTLVGGSRTNERQSFEYKPNSSLTNWAHGWQGPAPFNYCFSVANGERLSLRGMDPGGRPSLMFVARDTAGVELCPVWLPYTFPHLPAAFDLEFQDTNHAVLGTVRVRYPFR
jgi:hypothetical protein